MRAALRQRSLVGSALVASLAGVLVSGVHDYLLQQDRLSIMGAFWMPYAVPVTVATFSASLELAKRGQIDLRQRETFAPIQIRRRDA